jgi:hypothetical protein
MSQRRLFRQGLALVLASLLLGFAIVASHGGVKGRLWLAAHTTGILVGLMLIAAGAVFPSVRLGDGAKRAAGWLLIAGAWAGFWVLGVFTAVMAIPLPVAAPSSPEPAGWVMAVNGAGILVVAVGILVGWSMLLWGLRGND